MTDTTALQLQTSARRIQDLIYHLFEAKPGTWESFQYQALLQEREVQAHYGPPLKTTGIHLFPNGTTFVGTLVNYQPTGVGIITALDKTTYEGFFTLDPPSVPKTEIGILLTPQDPFVQSCRGSFYEGTCSGYGEIVCSNDDRYEGTLIQNRLFGKGTYFFYKDNEIYRGDFIDNARTGVGVFLLQDGARFEGNFIDGRPSRGIYTSFSGNQLRSESPELGDLLFVRLLLGIKNTIIPNHIVFYYALHSLRKQKYQTTYNLIKYATYINEKRLDSTQINPLAREIHEDLMKGIPRLIPFRSRTHAMGLLISPELDEKEESSSFILNIYNSGKGLHEHHYSDEDTNKFATNLQIEIPTQSLTTSLIGNLLKMFSSVDEAYETLFAIPDSQILGASTIWQTPQKGDNCSLEWIFAFLKNEMEPYEYDQWRLDLFTACIESGDALHTEGRAKQEWEQLKPMLLQKIKKRKKRLKAHQRSSNSATNASAK